MMRDGETRISIQNRDGTLNGISSTIYQQPPTTNHKKAITTSSLLNNYEYIFENNQTSTTISLDANIMVRRPLRESVGRLQYSSSYDTLLTSPCRGES